MERATSLDTPALSVEGLSHSYGARKALDDVSFAVRRASFVALLGLNGAGKSTLFSLVTRLYPIRSGRVAVFGYDVAREPGAALREIGVVFQPRTLDLDLSVMQNFVYHAALHGIGARAARARADELLAQIALTERADDKVRNLSGGQMRRVEIARALLHRPRLLILDEPTVGLDIKARADILSHVRMLVQQNDTSVVWATHLVDEVSDTDGLIMLHRGRVLAHGAVSDVLARTGGENVGGAFTRLTRDTDASEAA
jgi:ABC-2 type transport system ATP-binding protein